MQLTGQATLLRIFVGEADRIDHKPVYEIIVKAARDHSIAGATVLRGIMAYGASTKLWIQKKKLMHSSLSSMIFLKEVKKVD